MTEECIAWEIFFLCEAKFKILLSMTLTYSCGVDTELNLGPTPIIISNITQINQLVLETMAS